MTGITASRIHAHTIVGASMGVRVAKDLVFDLIHINKFPLSFVILNILCTTVSDDSLLPVILFILIIFRVHTGR